MYWFLLFNDVILWDISVQTTNHMEQSDPKIIVYAYFN